MRRPLTIAALVLLPLALYARVATFGYVQADDVDLIRDNQAFLHDPRNVVHAFGRSYFESAGQLSDRKTYYRPIVVASFVVDAQMAGAEPRVYHLTNVLIHVAAVLLLFALLRTLGAGEAAAALLALLFAVHPANVQAVAWIPGRNDSLMAAFALLSLVALARHLATSSRPWLWLHVAAFALALFTKESALALVPLFVLYAAVWARRPRALLRNRLLLASDAVVVAGWFLLRRAALAGGGGGLTFSETLETLAANSPHLLIYPGKIVLPLHLNVMPGLTALDAALGGASLVVIVVWLAKLDAGTRWFVVAWMALFLAPALLVPGLPAYEHRLYFPLMAVMVGLSRFTVWSEQSRHRGVAAASVVAVTMAFAAIGFAQTGVFRDRYSYWGSATRGTPYAGLAHVNLGRIHEGDGDTARASDHYRRALVADPSTPGAHNNLGVLLARAGRLDEAKPHFEREVELHPANADAHFNIGLIYKLTGRLDAARPWWERTIAMDPAHLAAHEELAGYYAARGDTERANAYRERARALQARGAR